ncbi:MAG: carboxypeptidase-like regulatory domain-containing protein, partial [Bacteroidaceae bacterium]|nr:carboxypeptidase-like regulatory domain-containing protein [Bacteroidaceae bacterium]
MRRLLTYVILSMLCSSLDAQEQGGVVAADSVEVAVQDTARCSLHGRVTDEDGKALPFANVRVEGRGVGTMTNLNGEYTIDFQTADSVRVKYTLMGFEPKEKVLLRPRGKLAWNVQLRQSGTQMGELVVSEVRRQMGQTQELSTQELKRMPSTTGNAVEELVATQAGVSTHNEMSS